MEQSFFAGNRQRLLEVLPAAKEFLLVSFSGQAPRRTADENYPFYTNRGFVYLMGLEQENLIYVCYGRGEQRQELLFLPDTDPMAERWTGQMLTAEEARARSGIREVLSRERFDSWLHRQLSGLCQPTVWLDIDPPETHQASEPGQKFAAAVKQRYPYAKIANYHPQLRRLRTVKQPQELAQLRESLAITEEGIEAMLRACRPGQYEYQLRGVFEAVLADRGVRQPAFDTIVAAGKNALYMHYPEQDSRIADGDLILIDLGAQAGYCGADISRVFPANGRFTDRQKKLHAACLENITYLCTALKPGMAMWDIDRLGDEHMFPALREMGLVTRLEEVQNYRWHATSHHLGFDTHDDNDYQMPLCSGMVFTMEVGIYVPQWGEGVRIEDNILMTDTGCENQSAFIPRTVKEIEAIMA